MSRSVGYEFCRPLHLILTNHSRVSIECIPYRRYLDGHGAWWLQGVQRRDARPRHCSKGVQPVPKTAYHSGIRDKYSRPRCDSNLGPLTLQSGALTTRPLQQWVGPVRIGKASSLLLRLSIHYPHQLAQNAPKPRDFKRKI